MDSDGLEDVLKRLEFLYLCIPESKFLSNIVKWVNLCVELRELWVSISYVLCVKSPDNLKGTLHNSSYCQLLLTKLLFIVIWPLQINNIDCHSYMRCDKPIELQHLERIVLYPCTVWPVIVTRAELKQNWRSIPSITKSGKNYRKTKTTLILS